MSFTSKVFETRVVKMADREETIVAGGRHLFPLLPKAFDGIRQIGVIGWSSQGPAQAQNLRESLEGTGIRVKVGLREGSSSMKEAAAVGFTKENGTLGEMYDVIRESDMSLLLISDAAFAENYQEIFAAFRPGTTLGLSHGFLLSHLQATGRELPEGHQRRGRLPQGHGPVGAPALRAGPRGQRRRHQCELRRAAGRQRQGDRLRARLVGGARLALHLRDDARIGVPLRHLRRARHPARRRARPRRKPLCALCRPGHGQGRRLPQHLRIDHRADQQDDLAFRPQGRVRAARRKEKAAFRKAFNAAYHPSREILEEIYDDVASGNEVRSVIQATRRHGTYPMGKIDSTDMWVVGDKVRANASATMRRSIRRPPGSTWPA